MNALQIYLDSSSANFNNKFNGSHDIFEYVNVLKKSLSCERLVDIRITKFYALLFIYLPSSSNIFCPEMMLQLMYSNAFCSVGLQVYNLSPNLSLDGVYKGSYIRNRHGYYNNRCYTW
jgi:hypothetical protein